MEPSEWPTKARLELLREEGKFPYSRFSQSCAIAMAIYFSLFSVVDNYLVVIESWHKLFDEKGLSLQSGTLIAFSALRPLMVTLSLPILVVTFVAIFGALLQSKFLFRWRLVKIDSNRLSRWARWSVRDFLMQTLLYAFAAVLVLILLGLVVVGSYGNLFRLLNGNLTSWGAWLVVVQEYVGLWLMPLLMVFGLIAWLINRLLFMIGHRMTREEILREQED